MCVRVCVCVCERERERERDMRNEEVCIGSLNGDTSLELRCTIRNTLLGTYIQSLRLLQ